MAKSIHLRSLGLTILFLLLITVILVAPIKKSPFNSYDEGFAVFNAIRIVEGQIPYRDFWTIYPPGQFYALAAIFKVAGPSLLTARIYDTLIRLLIAVCIGWIASKIVPLPLGLFAAVAAALLLSYAGFYTYAVFPALLLGLLAIVSLLGYTDTRQLHRLFLAGTSIGLAAFFRWDIGLYAGISVGTALLLFSLLSSFPESSTANRVRFTTKILGVLVSGALTVSLLSYGYIGYASGLDNLWEQVVHFPANSLHQVRWLPYPSPLFPLTLISSVSVSGYRITLIQLLRWFHFYAPLALYGIAFISYAHVVYRTRLATSQVVGGVAVVSFGVLLFAQALSRYDYIHVAPTLILATLVAILLLCHNPAEPEILGANLLRILIWSGLIVLLIVPLKELSEHYAPNRVSPLGCYSQVERAGCIRLSEQQQKAIEYIGKNTQDDESIFVGNQRHDLIFVNDIGFYFLANRKSVTQYSELYPGVATTLQVQRSIVGEIEAEDVNWIVLVDTGISQEPNDSSVSSGVTFLDNYIRSQYELDAEFGAYQIWRRSEIISTR